MTIDIAEEPMTALAEYARLPIAFHVDQVLDVTARADGGFALSARRLEIPYVKDYDAVDGEGPLHWARRFDVSNWRLFTARVAGSRVGGATVAFNTPGLTMLEGRRDLSVLWDIRVAPDARGKGVGSALFQRVEAWAQCARLSSAQGRDAEYQCARLRVLCAERVRAPSGPPCRVS